MPLSLKELLTPYAAAMHEGDAAFFIGAGLSRSAGFVDWKEFLKKCALEIGLDVTLEEHDLVQVAQFYLNSKRDRSPLNQALIDEFSKPRGSTYYHRILARLPVSTIWTTNYDLLIEEALRKNRKRVDVKLRDGDLAWRKPGRAAVLYKMHGDIGHPQEVVICKDDYECYPRTHPIFQNALEGDLVSKTFLFLGFSFKDPNLGQTLGHLRSLLRESKRAHYAVMRKVRLKWNDNWESAKQQFEYETVKQRHQIENLQRYSIYTHLVDRYRDIKGVLRSLECEYSQRIIYLWARESANQTMNLAELSNMLGARLMNDEYKLFCELNTRLGRAVFAGAQSKIAKNHLDPSDKYLLRPMPAKQTEARLSSDEFTNLSRKAMIKKSGFVIFLGGSELDRSEIAKDFAFAKRVRTVPIPLGSSGSAANTIWESVKRDLDGIYGRAVKAETFYKLVDNDLETIVDGVLEIIRSVSSQEPEQAKRRPMSESDRRSVYETLKWDFEGKLPDKTIRRIAADL